MIRSMKTGTKVSAKEFAKEALATAVKEVIKAWSGEVSDLDMTEKEVYSVRDQLQKVSARLLAKLETKADGIVEDSTASDSD